MLRDDLRFHAETQNNFLNYAELFRYIEQYQQKSSQTERIGIAEEIFDKFFNEASNKKIQLFPHSRQNLQANLLSGDVNLFQKVIQEIEPVLIVPAVTHLNMYVF